MPRDPIPYESYLTRRCLGASMRVELKDEREFRRDVDERGKKRIEHAKRC